MEYIKILLQEFTSPDMFIALLVAIGGGIFIGAMPGMGATMAVALLIPVTYSMSIISGMTMLTVVYASCVFGGSITAILLKTPGTLGNAATAIEGYELTKQGRGLEAIGWSMTSSCVGGVMSAIAVLIIAPWLAQFALRFSSPEYFLLAILGLTLIGSIGSESLAKGLFAGVLGLLIASIGMEPQTGYNRFTFGITSLSSGVSMVPALMGMFSLVQIMTMAERLGTSQGMKSGQVLVDKEQMGKRVLPPIGEFIKKLPLTIGSGIIGILIGILPGVGGDVASYVGYSFSKRVSKHPEEFGKGAIEGIIGPEAANNGVTGGSFIPLFTLGIPGSGTAAVLLGGLILHGLNPGITLFTTQKNIVFPILIAFLVGNVLTFIACTLLSKQVAKCALVPMNILAPIIVVACLVGAFSINKNIFDVYLTVIFGFLGYFLKKTKVPVAPVVLGLILGNMCEEGFNSSVIMSKGNLWQYFTHRPICLAFMIIIALFICKPIFAYVFKRTKLISGQRSC